MALCPLHYVKNYEYLHAHIYKLIIPISIEVFESTLRLCSSS